MALRGKLLQQLVLGVIILAASAVSNPNLTCNRSCGSLDIPYPFGTTESCYLDPTFLITCNDSYNPPKPFLDPDLFVEDISLDGELRISSPVASLCKSSQYTKGNGSIAPCGRSPDYASCLPSRVNYSRIPSLLKLSNFRISDTRNKITAVGCDVYTYIQGSMGQKGFTTGCLSLCNSSTAPDVVNGSCSGIGCCQTSIPKEATEYSLSVRRLSNDTGPNGIGQCGYGFIVDKEAYNFSTSDFENLRNNETVPLVLDWAVGNETCEDAQKNQKSYACKATHSNCYNSSNGPGYRCNCSQGYKGNPYLPDGSPDSCQDINECDELPCNSTAMCTNNLGSFRCSCPKGYEGDGMRNGTGCSPKVGQSKIILIGLGVSTSLLILLMGSSWVYWGLKKRKLIKLKVKFFEQNGGLMLQQQLPNHKGNVETVKIFSPEELEKATNNYNESRVLGRGGYGIVYRGILPDNKVVAIKKSKICDQSQIEQFINEVIMLTQINHRNVVKLLGCCLETEVPLLVYEFITNGTLYDHIHDKSLSFSLSWKNRLKIATEAAGAFAYLHSEASIPIIHRDVKTTNILLDENLTAKVSDFGASRLIPLDCTQLTTLVQGTLGYLDPEYFHTSQLTDKSDVYSFGVVIAELLTGKKALSFDRPESKRNLAVYFDSVVEEDRLFPILEDRILNEGNIEELKKAANIARSCLRVRGEDRPTMKEVAKELEGLRIMENH